MITDMNCEGESGATEVICKKDSMLSAASLSTAFSFETPMSKHMMYY